MTSINNLRVDLFKYSKEPFIQLLNENHIEFQERHFPPGTVMMAGETLEIISKLADASIWLALSKVIVAFLEKGKSR